MKHSFWPLVVILSFALNLTLPPQVNPATPSLAEPHKAKALKDVARYREEAEQKVKYVKQLHKKGWIMDEGLGAIERAYIEAAARGNAFIETVQDSLSEKTDEPTLRAALNADTEAIKSCLEKLDGTINVATVVKGGPTTDVDAEFSSRDFSSRNIFDPYADVIRSLVDAGVKLWQAVRSAKKEDITAMKQELEKRRWKHWDQIKLSE